MYIKLTNGVPEKYTIGQLRRDNSQVSFPKDIPQSILAEFGVFLCSETVQPSHNPATHKVVEGVPAQVNGTWLQVWNIVDLTAKEIAEYQTNLQNSIVQQTQQRLDDFARTRGYDSILSLCTYATDTNTQFQTEGQYGVISRSSTWTKLYEILDEVMSGTRPIPTSFEDIESELPILSWPI